MERDVLRAVNLYETAIEGGNVLAMISLADLLRRWGGWMEKDIPRAKELYLRAAAADPNTRAAEQLALLCKRSYSHILYSRLLMQCNANLVQFSG